MPLFCATLLAIVCFCPDSDSTWQMHVIDSSSKGADGVRLGDINSDGLQDIVTGWEQGGIVRVYLNPGSGKSKKSWPQVTIGQAPNVEDAVFVDLDQNGVLDVVSSCEGNTKQHFVHWAPDEKADLLDASKWKTETIPATEKLTRWMFCLPLDVDGKHGTDLIVGSKDPNGQIGWLESPEKPRDLAAWKYHKMQSAGWIMSLRKFDFNLDGKDDVLVSDRKGDLRGVYWLRNGPNRTSEPWERKIVSGDQKEFMFLDVWRDSTTNQSHVVTATRNGDIEIYRSDDSTSSWAITAVANPNEIPHGKAVAAGDINLDGKIDLVHSTNTGDSKLPGVAVLLFNENIDGKKSPQATNSNWKAQAISNADGIKYDRIELLDLDGDGDLDVLTCEERKNLGVIWFENPTR